MVKQEYVGGMEATEIVYIKTEVADDESSAESIDKSCEELNTELQFILSRRHKQKLCFNGYQYVRDKVVKGKTFWRCELYRTIFCKCRVTTLGNKVVRMTGEHNHADDGAKLEADKVLMKIWEDSKYTSESPQVIVSNAAANIDTAVIAKLPSLASMKRKIRCIKIEETEITKREQQEVEMRKDDHEEEKIKSSTRVKAPSTFFRQRHAEIKKMCEQVNEQGERFYRCNVCGVVYMACYNFIEHYVDHLPGGCKSSKKIALKKKEKKKIKPVVNKRHEEILARGRALRQGRGMYRCEVCFCTTSDSKVFIDHVLSHHTQEKIIGKDCRKIEDICKVTGDNGKVGYVCIICEKMYSIPVFLRNHFVMHKGSEEALRGNGRYYRARNEEIRKGCAFIDDKGVTCYRCSVCEKLLGVGNIVAHYQNHIEKGELYDDGTPTVETKTKIMARLVEDEVRQRCKVSTFNYKCEYCDKVMRGPIQIVSHYDIHADKIAYFCKLCSFKNMYKCNLDEHMREAHGKGTSQKREVLPKTCGVEECNNAPLN